MDSWEQLEPLYDHFDGMVASIRREAGGDAEDIVQGAFMKLSRKLDAGFEVRNLRGLLNKTLKNDLLDYLRRQKLEEEIQNDPALAGHAPVGDIDQHMFALDVDDELHSMAEGRARAWVATQLQGASGIEAAQALDTSPEAVREATHHARKRLQERLS
jgi:RNA polymerase sigma factor (sigma-70 family)